MVTSKCAPPLKFGCKSLRIKTCQFSKSTVPKQQEKAPRCYQASTNRTHSKPLAIPVRTTNIPLDGSASRTRSSRTSYSHFAGSKCFETPTPSSLPMPPTNWFAPVGGRCSEDSLDNLWLYVFVICDNLNKYICKITHFFIYLDAPYGMFNLGAIKIVRSPFLHSPDHLNFVWCDIVFTKSNNTIINRGLKKINFFGITLKNITEK